MLIQLTIDIEPPACSPVRPTRKSTILVLAILATASTPALCRAQGSQGYAISTVAGNGTQNYSGDGGPATSAEMQLPRGVAVDSAGNLYIADTDDCVIRKVSPIGTITTVAGNGCGYSGDGGPATGAELNFPNAVAVDNAGNLYIADTINNRVRKVAANGTITTIAGTGALGAYDESGASLGDGGPGVNAELGLPEGVALDAAGNVYIADSFTARVRKVGTDGIITTVAGSGMCCIYPAGDGGPATSAEIVAPYGVAVDTGGNIYISDYLRNVIRKVSPTGTITTVAGTGAGSYFGDGGPATSAGFYQPWGIAVDSSGNLYIADNGDERIREVLTNGTIISIAGNSDIGYSGDGGPATSAELNYPTGVAVSAAGDVYVADCKNNVIRLLTPASQVTGTPPSVSPGGVVSASAFGEFTSVAPSSWIEIYGSNLAPDTRSWTGNDFNGVNAPESLDGTSVTIGGQPAYVAFISPGQVNVQVPSNIGTGPQPLIVTTQAGGAGNAYSVTVNTEQPGLLAPSSFNLGGNQYVVALFPDNITYVLPTGAIAGITSRSAQPGDTIILYGVGFGAVTPSTPAGQLAEQLDMLDVPFHLFFGSTEATVAYDGLAPGYVGLYQFNVVVPNVSSNDPVALTFTLGGNQGAQTLYIAVQ
jgi:uncharacterized protein (TIGR03437 family)